MENVIIFGASGHARVIIDILEKQKTYEIIGVFVDNSDAYGNFIMGYPILGEISQFYGAEKGIIAIGDNYVRRKIARKIKSINEKFEFINAIHPSAVIGKNVSIGSGTVVGAGSIVNTNVKIGENCIVNTKASIDHDAMIGEYSSVAPGATIGGNVVIGNLSAVSMGANVIQKIKIGNGSLVGAGATVISDIPDGVLAYGVPAKIIRKRNIDEKYL